MKTYLPLLLMLFLISSCQGKHASPSSSDSTQAVIIAPENLMALKFEVSGMSCTGCENTINASVKTLPGIGEVTSSHTDSFTLVKFDKTLTTAEAIKDAIEAKGYTVKGFYEEGINP
jgi:copper chaperone CopZ